MKRIIMAGLGLLVLAACTTAPASTSQKSEQALTEQYQNTFSKAEPYPVSQMKDSLERKNLIKRLLEFNDPAKVGYLYIVTAFGKPLGYYVVQGKVSSVDSQLTTPDLINGCPGDNSSCAVTTTGPGDDGSYGPNEGGDQGIFFFTEGGVLVETDLPFLYSDYPLPFDVPQLVPSDAKPKG